jgi:hypothetical protein
MSEAEKRSVHTDALATLGTIIGEGEKRDAIHLAVEPTVAAEKLYPGQDVGVDGSRNNPVGIVDPFLKSAVMPGERFWLIVYPRQINSLRHVWTHPAFGDEPMKPTAVILSPADASRKWIEDFAVRIDQTYNRLMEAADLWIDQEDYTYDNSERYKDHWDEFPEFWKHYEVVKGRAPKVKSSFFTCSC